VNLTVNGAGPIVLSTLKSATGESQKHPSITNRSAKLTIKNNANLARSVANFLFFLAACIFGCQRSPLVAYCVGAALSELFPRVSNVTYADITNPNEENASTRFL